MTSASESAPSESANDANTSLPRVIVKRRRALPFFNRHPWVFAGAIQRVEGQPQPADEVALVSAEGKFIARGLYNPDSNIRVRLYSWDEGIAIDRPFLSARLDEAIALRQVLFTGDQIQFPHRIVYSEADGLSGLIVDRYGDWLIIQLTSLAVAHRREALIELLNEKLSPRGIWLRTEKGIRAAEGLTIKDGLLSGEEPPRPMFVEENGIQFGVDVVQGQKTGLFLDQRENRQAVARYVTGRRVLDMFCYTGGFSLAAAKLGNAKEIIGIDSSETAITTAKANAELNEVVDRLHFEKADAFTKLEQLSGAGERFDAVILDPPKMARNRSGLNKAMRGYHSLNQLAISVLNANGILVTCSCSGHVSRELFETMLSSVAESTNRPIQILESCGAAADHPVSASCLENGYLKCYICRVV